MTSTKAAKSILIVDDEANLLAALSTALKNSGYQVFVCQNPLKAEELLEKNEISLALIDVWMPELDGYTLLKKIKQLYPELPVIITSGHASISTSIEVVKRGAEEFLEKPFSIAVLLSKVKALLKENPLVATQSPAPASSRLFVSGETVQHTIKKNVVLKGKGLHTGKNSGIILSPLPPDNGIIFQDLASGKLIKAHPANVGTTFYSTNLELEEISLKLIEHLMSALHVYGIDNVLIKASEEIPILDGSALPFCQLLEEARAQPQEGAKRRCLQIEKSYRVEDPTAPDKWIEIAPGEGLSLSYRLQLPKEFGNQHYEVTLFDSSLSRAQSIKRFKQQIAPCRTFGFVNETKHIQSAGVGAKGADLANALLLHENQVINGELKFPNEFARHKIIDILGDLYLLGVEIKGKITAHKTGHRHNVALARKILGL